MFKNGTERDPYVVQQNALQWGSLAKSFKNGHPKVNILTANEKIYKAF